MAGLARGRLAEPEEGVALHGTLPQVLAVLGVVQLEHKRVLLLPILESEKETNAVSRLVSVCLCVLLRLFARKVWAGV